ncbi:hypothetical protein MASR2M78_19990 [Treponema sp.]
MAGKKKIPEIRFQGFSGEWEGCKYYEIAEIRRGLTYKPEDVANTGVRVLRSSNINEDRFEQKDDDVFVNEDAINIPFVNENDILITSANGSNRLVGKHAIINNINQKTVHGGFMLLATAKNPCFLNASMSSHWYSTFLDLYIAGGNGAIGNLSKTDLANQDICIPNETEQSKIGTFFQNLDSLITLHQRKYDKLTTVKKGMLEKMFPKDGADVPELRFKGFAGKWEQKELSRMTQKIGSGKTPKGGGATYVSEGIALLRSQNIRNNAIDMSDVAYITHKTDEDMTNSRVSKNDILLNITGASIGRSAVYRLSVLANVNQHVCIIRPINGFYPDFIQLNLASADGQKKIDENQAGGGREGLNFEQIGKMSFMFPTIEEQTQIATFFQHLDSLISLQQKELDKLKNIKKACLEKMFV